METNLSKCKTCLETKERTLVGKYKDNVNKKYTDHTGSLWNGRNCPRCHRTKCREQITSKRKLTSFTEGLSFEQSLEHDN